MDAYDAVVFAQTCVAVGNKSLIAALDQDDDRIRQIDVGQPLTEPFVVIIDFLLGQLYEVFVLAFGGAEDQRIIFKQGCISLRGYASSPRIMRTIRVLGGSVMSRMRQPIQA